MVKPHTTKIEQLIARLFSRFEVRPDVGPKPTFFRRFGVTDPLSYQPGRRFGATPFDSKDGLVFLSIAPYLEELYAAGIRERLSDRFHHDRWLDRYANRSPMRTASKTSASVLGSSMVPDLSTVLAEPLAFLTPSVAPQEARISPLVPKRRALRSPWGRTQARRSATGGMASSTWGQRATPISRTLSRATQVMESAALPELVEDLALVTGGSSRTMLRRAAQVIAALPQKEQAAAARKITRVLRSPIRAVAQRYIEEEVAHSSTRSLDVARSRPVHGTKTDVPSKGLQRVLEYSPALVAIAEDRDDLMSEAPVAFPSSPRRRTQIGTQGHSSSRRRVFRQVAEHDSGEQGRRPQVFEMDELELPRPQMSEHFAHRAVDAQEGASPYRSLSRNPVAYSAPRRRKSERLASGLPLAEKVVGSSPFTQEIAPALSRTLGVPAGPIPPAILHAAAPIEEMALLVPSVKPQVLRPTEHASYRSVSVARRDRDDRVLASPRSVGQPASVVVRVSQTPKSETPLAPMARAVFRSQPVEVESLVAASPVRRPRMADVATETPNAPIPQLHEWPTTIGAAKRAHRGVESYTVPTVRAMARSEESLRQDDQGRELVMPELMGHLDSLPIEHRGRPLQSEYLEAAPTRRVSRRQLRVSREDSKGRPLVTPDVLGYLDGATQPIKQGRGVAITPTGGPQLAHRMFTPVEQDVPHTGLASPTMDEVLAPSSGPRIEQPRAEQPVVRRRVAQRIVSETTPLRASPRTQTAQAESTPSYRVMQRMVEPTPSPDTRVALAPQPTAYLTTTPEQIVVKDALLSERQRVHSPRPTTEPSTLTTPTRRMADQEDTLVASPTKVAQDQPLIRAALRSYAAVDLSEEPGLSLAPAITDYMQLAELVTEAASQPPEYERAPSVVHATQRLLDLSPEIQRAAGEVIADSSSQQDISWPPRMDFTWPEGGDGSEDLRSGQPPVLARPTRRVHSGHVADRLAQSQRRVLRSDPIQAVAEDVRPILRKASSPRSLNLDAVRRVLRHFPEMTEEDLAQADPSRITEMMAALPAARRRILGEPRLAEETPRGRGDQPVLEEGQYLVPPKPRQRGTVWAAERRIAPIGRDEKSPYMATVEGRIPFTVATDPQKFSSTEVRRALVPEQGVLPRPVDPIVIQVPRPVDPILIQVPEDGPTKSRRAHSSDTAGASILRDVSKRLSSNLTGFSRTETDDSGRYIGTETTAYRVVRDWPNRGQVVLEESQITALVRMAEAVAGPSSAELTASTVDEVVGNQTLDVTLDYVLGRTGQEEPRDFSESPVSYLGQAEAASPISTRGDRTQALMDAAQFVDGTDPQTEDVDTRSTGGQRRSLVRRPRPMRLRPTGSPPIRQRDSLVDPTYIQEADDDTVVGDWWDTAEGFDAGQQRGFTPPAWANAPAWARRATEGTGATPTPSEGSTKYPTHSGSILQALARADGVEDVVRVILERELAGTSLSVELPEPALRVVQRIASEARTAQGLPERELRPAQRDSGVNMQGPRVVRQEVLRSAQPMTRSSGSGSSIGPAVGESKVMGLASKLRDLIHLAESDRRLSEAQAQVRMAEDSAVARQQITSGVKGGAGAKEGDMQSLQQDVLQAVLSELEKTQQRREDPDGRSIWW